MSKATEAASHDSGDTITTTTTMTPLDFLKRFKRLSPLEPSLGIASFFLVTLLFFVGCFFYLDYRGLRSWGTDLLGLHVPSLSSSSVSSSNAPPVVEFLGQEGDKCDVFDGKWVWDETYPLYHSTNCSFIDQGFRCSENGRPDSFYTKWRWQPKDCNLPRFQSYCPLSFFFFWVEFGFGF